VQLRNIILRDNDDAGLRVGSTGSAELISATLVRNGSGVRAAGATLVRNALITANAVGLEAVQPGVLTSRYNDVYQNRDVDTRNVTGGVGDLTTAVEFAQDRSSLRLIDRQATTDRGDPADEFTEEPAPNGGRINIGAFGNTTFAELSGLGPSMDVDAGVDGAVMPDAGAAADGAPDGTPSLPAQGCGCRVGQASGTRGDAGAAALVLLVAGGLVVRRRRR
jgi:MYXO-CTERM domain-containing protein